MLQASGNFVPGGQKNPTGQSSFSAVVGQYEPAAHRFTMASANGLLDAMGGDTIRSAGQYCPSLHA